MTLFDLPEDLALMMIAGGIVVAMLLGSLFLWAVVSFVNSHRRIARALEELERAIGSPPPKKADGEPTEWSFEEPVKPVRKNP